MGTARRDLQPIWQPSQSVTSVPYGSEGGEMTGHEGCFSGMCCVVISCCVLATYILFRGDTARSNMAATRLGTWLDPTEMYQYNKY